MGQLVTTSVAAKELGLSRSTLQRWAAQGLVEPDLVTIGGQFRWDVERLRGKLHELADERRGEH